MGTTSFLCVYLVKIGYESIIRAVFSVLLYLFYWTMIAIQHDMVSGPAELAIVNLMVIPLAYFYRRKGQTIACLSAAGANFVCLLLYKKWFRLKENLVLTPEAVDTALTAMIISISASVLVVVYFNTISHKLYDDVKQMNEKLEASSKEKEEFFATVSHEIRNPLQSLLGSVELLQDNQLQAAKPLLEICKNCGEAVLNLVSNILDMSKIAAEKMVLSMVPADLREIINRVLRISQSRAQAKGLELRVIDNKKLPPSLELDPQRVEQIVLNLVSNAIKFTAKGRVVVKLDWIPLDDEEENVEAKVQDALSHTSWKEVMEFNESDISGTIRLQRKYQPNRLPSLKGMHKRRVIEEENETVEEASHPALHLSHGFNKPNQGVAKIEIMDTGIGISKENSSKLFQPYQQANSNISRKYGGTGLGLWISKNILKQMKGEIKVKSKEGKGSNFILAFPAKVCQEVPAFEGKHEDIKLQEQFKDKVALVIDDIPENMFLTEELLSRYGIHSICIADGVEALEKYKSRANIDLIITDLRMPMMSGQTFIIEVRKYEEETKKKRTPIIVVTAESAAEEKKTCIAKYGADEYLIKPMKYQDLISAIAKLLIGYNRYSSRGSKDHSKKVLIVDDDAVSAKFMSNVLDKAGNECIVGHSVKEAKELFKKECNNCDAIFLDNILQDGIGVDFLEFVQKLVEEKEVRMPFVISMSGNTVQDQKEMYRGYKVGEFLQKPIRKSDLLDIMQII